LYSFLLNQKITENTVVPCYFFHGEETFLAYQFINELKSALLSDEVQEYNVERFNLDEKSWAEVIDLARTIPFFLSPWRIIVVEVSTGKKESLSSQEQRILEDYFTSLSSRTVMVIIFSGKIRKTSSLFKYFSSLPSTIVLIKELRPLKERALYAWMGKKFLSKGKTADPEAMRRLEELVGNDLRRISNEMEKLMTYVGEKSVIELDDVNQISGWVKTFFEWEISDSLARADFGQCLIVLNNLFKEGIKPEYILGSVVRFFRDILQAKLLVKEKDVDKKAIFKELRPQIHEKFGNFYTTKLKEFFSLVERFSMKDLNYVLTELEKVDLKIKTSGLNPKTLLESFLSDYCRLREKDKVTWKAER
jgi:DNA polymerase III delta subunit